MRKSHFIRASSVPLFFVLLATPILTCLAGCCAGQKTEAKLATGEHDRIGALITLDPSSRTYTILVKNTSSVAIGVYNDVTASEYTHEDFGPAQIRVRNTKGANLPELSSGAADWWTFGLLSSQGHPLPIHLTSLAPGETMMGIFSLDRLMLGNSAWTAIEKDPEWSRSGFHQVVCEFNAITIW
jgi:hypothetical protein